MHERCSYSNSAHNVSVKLSPSLCSYSSCWLDWTNGCILCMCSICVTLGEISSVLLAPARLMMRHLPSMIPSYHTAIAHCHGQLTVVIDMGYGNGVWSDQELTTGGACVRYAKVIKHKGEERGIPQTYYTARTKK